MEKDTVVLDIKRYNQLRDFEKEIMNGKIYTVSRLRFSLWETASFYTHNEVISQFEDSNKVLEAKISELNDVIKKHTEDSEANKEFNISEIKKMSIWQFLKWRKS